MAMGPPHERGPGPSYSRSQASDERDNRARFPLRSGGASTGSADSLAPPLPLFGQQYSRTLQSGIREP